VDDQIERWAASMSDGTFDWSSLDPDITIWHSYDGVDMTLDEELALLESTKATVKEVQAENVTIRRHERGALLDYVLRAAMVDGSVIRMPAFALVRTEDGRITRIEEYTEIVDDDGRSAG
jgi:ketosteroid isomerase-like protein